MTDTVRVPRAELTAVVAAVFAATGMGESDAALAADVLADADARGIASHGVANVDKVYLPRLRDGRIDPRAREEIVVDAGALVNLDAHRALGLVVASRAMDLAIARAATHGLSAVLVHNSSHFGAAGTFVRQAIARGMMAVVSTNLGEQAVAPHPDGRASVVGSNPIAAGGPAGELPPLLLDMSTTVVATGRVKRRAASGDTVPRGWLVDGGKEPVTDPRLYLDGRATIEMLGGRGETSGYKGFGLALAVDMLCGILAGAAVGPNAANARGERAGDANVGHFFLVIDAARVRPRDELLAAMDDMLRATLESGGEARYPGWRSDQLARESARLGIPVGRNVWQELRALAAERGA